VFQFHIVWFDQVTPPPRYPELPRLIKWFWGGLGKADFKDWRPPMLFNYTAYHATKSDVIVTGILVPFAACPHHVTSTVLIRTEK
jgi:hypothetical protein